jgi:hypothetical protein
MHRVPILGTLAAAAIALAVSAASGPEPRALLIDRRAEEVQLFLRLPAEAVAEMLAASSQGARLLAEIGGAGGRLDTLAVQDRKVELLDAIAPGLSLEIGGDPVALEPIGLLAHPEAEAGPFGHPLDAWRAIGVCLTGGAPEPRFDQAVFDIGLVAWPVDGAAPLRLTASLPGLDPDTVRGAAFADGRPLPMAEGREAWQVQGLPAEGRGP